MICAPKLVFLHIPKCGGTSIHHALASRFEPYEICPERFRGLRRFNQEQMQNFRFFSGHFTAKEFDLIPGNKYTITILRDPKERILSLYYFWRRHKHNVVERGNLRGPRVARQLSLADFLVAKTSPPHSAVKNGITCALAGHVVPVGEERYHLNGAIDAKRIEPDEVLRRALSAMKRLDVIGFITAPAMLVQRVCADLNLGEPPAIGRLNTRNACRPEFEPVEEEEITPEISELLDRCTDLDRIVYQTALSRAVTIGGDIVCRSDWAAIG